jgi:hypothetical protein
MRQPEGLPEKLLDKRVALQEGIPFEIPAPEHLAADRAGSGSSTSASSAASSSSTTSDVTVDAAAAAEVEAET